MKQIKTFTLGNDKEVNEYFKEHKDDLTGSIIHISDESVVIILETEREKMERTSALLNKRLDILKRNDDSETEIKNRQEFLNSKNRYFAELEKAKGEAKDKEARKAIDKRISEVGNERGQLKNQIAEFEIMVEMGKNNLKMIDELLLEISKENE